jgi:hypothetical protein
VTHLKHEGSVRWANYHRTIVNEALDAWRFDSGSPGSDLDYFRDAAIETGQLMAQAGHDGIGLRPVGAAWSFSNILRGGRTLFETESTNRIHVIAPSEKGPGAGTDPLVLVAAGTILANLNKAIERDMALRTSGAHDGQTVAGLLGTGTHGSVIGYGAFQNQVRGVHLVVGPQESVWIERGPRHVLAPAFTGQFATSIELDPELFEAVLVHLGGLGVLNAVLLEVAKGYTLEVVRKKRRLGLEDLRLLETGQFRAFAERVWPATAKDPHYVEVTLNPYHSYSETGGVGEANALVTIYFKIDRVPPRGPYPPAEDVLNLLEQAPTDPVEFLSLGEQVFKHVAGKFQETINPLLMSWGQAHGEHKKEKLGPFTIELYNAAYAMPRDRLLTALPIMLRAFTRTGLAPGVFTLRFVSASAGHLAFTAFPENVVVNIDGIRDKAFQLCASAAADVALALETAHLPFCQHWGKQGEITPRRFVACYGEPTTQSSRAGKWLAARRRLLSPVMQQVIRNADLVKWGLA